MPTYRSELLNVLDQRHYTHQITDAERLDLLASEQIVPGYVGFDPTASSLHVGSLVQIMLLRRLQQTGHKPIVVMGGGTGKIGDPSGRDESRQLMTEEVIAANIASIRKVFERILTFGDGPTDAVMVNNDEWLSGLGYLDLLRDVGPHFTVNRMLTFDSVKMRLDREQPLTFLEFNYMILQAYDFRELAERYGCRLQMGGSDQWGNIVNGIELTRRTGGGELFGFTTPLLTTADGKKMGKTASGAVWLNEDMLPAYDFWQFWRNTDDRDVGRFLRLFTDIPLDEIERLERLEGGDQRRQDRARQCGDRAGARRGCSGSGGGDCARNLRRGRGRRPAHAFGRRRHGPARCTQRAGLHRFQQGSQAQDRGGRGAARRRGFERPRHGAERGGRRTAAAVAGAQEARDPAALGAA